jgi:pimeloyl-ACP methyl ester carboxylesterase
MEVPLYYEVHGSGEPLVLLHGFGGSSLDWAPSAAQWAGDFQLIVPDMRGHGRSVNPVSEFRHDAAAGDILTLLDSLGVTIFKALGVSGGGNVLLHVATMQPDRVKAMVLVSATSHFPDQARAIMRNYSICCRRKSGRKCGEGIRVGRRRSIRSSRKPGPSPTATTI